MMEGWNNGMMEWEVEGSRYNAQIFPYPLFQYSTIPVFQSTHHLALQVAG